MAAPPAVFKMLIWTGVIFHVPFEKRHCVSTARYSIAGWPSLYLGRSLLVCWEELKRKPFRTLAAARFEPVGGVTILDFAFTPDTMGELHRPADPNEVSFFEDAELRNLMVSWPLLAACSIRAAHPGKPFLEEYIVPQLLMQWVRENEVGIDGIRYFSTRMQQDAMAPRLAINYVFPVKCTSSNGHCTTLAKKFRLTDPEPFRDLVETGFCSRNEGLQGLGYEDSAFGRAEAKLKDSEMGSLPVSGAALP